jgi:hypothetical protein
VLVGTEDGLFEVDGTARKALDGRVTALDASGWTVLDRTTLVQRVGDGWRPRLTFRENELRLISVTALGDQLFVGTSGAHVLRYRTGASSPRLEPVPLFDAVEGRDDWHAVGSAQPYVRSFTTTAGGVLLANVHVGGIPRSTDGGETWHPTIDPEADVHEVRAHPSRPDLVLAAAAVGLGRSDDAGATWTVTHEGLHGTYCRAVAFTSGERGRGGALVSASTGPFTDRAAVYRIALDGDGRLERVSGWQPHNIDTGCLDAAWGVAAFGGPDGVVHVSEDDGRTWQQAVGGLPPITALALPR